MESFFSGFDPNDPKTAGLLQMGLSLMQAKKGRGLLANVGEAAQKGLLGAGNVQNSALQRKLIESQISENEAQAQSKASALEQQQRFQDMISQSLGGPQSASGALRQGAAMGSVGPTNINAGLMQNANPLAQPNQTQNIPFDLVQKLTLAGAPQAKGLQELYKLGEGFKRDPGAFYDKPDGTREFIPRVTENASFQNGRMAPLPGSLETVSALEAAKVGAQEAAKLPAFQFQEAFKAGLDPREVNLPSGPVLTNRYTAATGGQPSALQRAPQLQIPPQVQAGRDVERLSILKQELASAKRPEDVAALTREIQSMGGAQIPGIPLKSEVQKRRDEKAVDLEAEQNKKAVDVGRFTSQLSAGIQQAENLLPNATGSGIGSAVDAGLRMFGASTPSSIAANQLETIAGWMTSNVPRMEGPQSDKDTEQYRIMAARIGDRSVPVKERQAAVQSLRSLMNNYQEINGALVDKRKTSVQSKPTVSNW